MARGDREMLGRWIAHHRSLAAAPEALHVVLHGPDPRLEAMARDCSLIVLPFDPSGADFEIRRARLFFGLVEALTGYYRHVVKLDVDEYLVPDPALVAAAGGVAGTALARRLDSTIFKGVALSPLGFDLTHRPVTEPEALDWTRPLTLQRRHGFLNVVYSKPCIFRARPPRGGNHHRLYKQPWQIDPQLLLIHARFADIDTAARISRKRIDTQAAFGAVGTDHRIRTWDDRPRLLRRAVHAIEAAPCPDLTLAAREAFAATHMQRYNDAGGVVVWKDGQSPGWRLPDEWVGLA